MQIYVVDRKVQIKHFSDKSAVVGLEYTKPINVAPLQGEVFVLQVVLLNACQDKVNDIVYKGKTEFSCINRDCVDKFGKEYVRQINLTADRLQSLFILLENAVEEVATITFVCDSGKYEICLAITPSQQVARNNGYDELWRLSRLKWLNSKAYIDDTIPQPFMPIEYADETIKILGREILLGNCGLPAQIIGRFDEGINVANCKNLMLSQPISFDIGQEITVKNRDIVVKKSSVSITTSAISKDCAIDYNVNYSYEGMIDCSIKLQAQQDCILSNVGLACLINSAYAKYINGLGEVGGAYKDINFKWDSARHLDSLYVGDVSLGLRLKLLAEDYVRPLINIYYKNQPLKTPRSTWDNFGRGGVTLVKKGDITQLHAYTGEVKMAKGESRLFRAQFHVLPLKPIDYKKHFATRYSHNNKLKESELKEVDTAKKHRLNNVIIHHGNATHPFINYPFIEAERLKNLVEYATARDIGIKVYYTVREHSNHMAEVFAYKALGDEIILRKKGEGYNWGAGSNAWLTEYFGEDIIPAWMVKYNYGKYKGDPDVSFIVRPDSRLDNYYIEGLKYLKNSIGIKGIYIDDTALDRTTLERARKALGDGLIDMHMWNHEEERAGDVSCMNLYTELFAFIDSLWIGEGYPYKQLTPEYLLMEVSGIPYGLTSQMLEGGGDFHIGMLYAMNNRYGWGIKTATKMYKVWDDFGIEQSTMYGYWHSLNPIKISGNKVYATTYLHKDKALVALYNFGDKTTISMDFCLDKMEFKPKSITSVAIKGVQNKKKYQADNIKLKAKSGIILLIE